MDKICCRFARVSPIYIKFRINLIDILLNTAFGQEQSFRNFAVTQALFHQTQDLIFLGILFLCCHFGRFLTFCCLRRVFCCGSRRFRSAGVAAQTKHSRQQQDEHNMPLYLKYSVKNALSFSNGMMSIRS